MRPIDADALLEKICPRRKAIMECANHDYMVGYASALSGVEGQIAAEPTIVVEPVVRCNTCKHYETDTGFCNYHGHGMRWDDYCSRGAKMDEEGENDK